MCPTSRQTCRKCGKTGHCERCCRAKGQLQVQEVDCVESGLALEPMRINVIGDQTSAVQYRRYDCELVGVHVSLVIDFVTKVSVLSKASYGFAGVSCSRRIGNWSGMRVCGFSDQGAGKGEDAGTVSRVQAA